MTLSSRLITIALVSLGMTACTHSFLRKGLDGGRAELHGASSIGLGAFRVTTTISNVPPWDPSGLFDEGGWSRHHLESEFAAVSVEGVCGDIFLSEFATALMAWTSALHRILGWEGQAEIGIHIGAAEGVHRRNHLSRQSAAPPSHLLATWTTLLRTGTTRHLGPDPIRHGGA